MLNLNAAEITVLKALIQNAEDCSGGDFAIMAEVKVAGMTRNALGGHITTLEQKGAISVHETFVNATFRSKGERVMQVLITDEAKAAVVSPVTNDECPQCSKVGQGSLCKAHAAPSATEQALGYFVKQLDRNIEDTEKQYLNAVERVATECKRAQDRPESSTLALNIGQWATQVAELHFKLEALKYQRSELRSALSFAGVFSK
jgi:hypothetical protein